MGTNLISPVNGAGQTNEEVIKLCCREEREAKPAILRGSALHDSKRDAFTAEELRAISEEFGDQCQFNSGET